MRRISLKLMAMVGLALPAGAAAVAVSAAGPATPATVSFSLSASAAGLVKSDLNQDPLTFVFTEKNTGSTAASEDLVLESLTNGSIVSVVCVLPNGAMFNPDGVDCEPGQLHTGQTSSSIINADVTGSSGSISAKVCLLNEGTGKTGACKTVSIPI